MTLPLPPHAASEPRRYLIPRRRGWRSAGGASALVALLLLAAAIAIVAATDHPTLASPGPLAVAHGAVGGTCAACHDGRTGVADARCIRCHASWGSGRLAVAAHAAAVSPLVTPGEPHDAVACATCHDDHRGARFVMTRVGDAACVTCHRGLTLAGHPEFAALRTGPASGTGLRLSHQRHMIEVRKIGKGCEACHERGAQDALFAPVDFDRHCASCHAKSGPLERPSDPVDPRLLLAGDAAHPVPPTREVDRGRVEVLARHRDPWILANLLRWRRALDPASLDAQRRAAIARLADIERALIDVDPGGESPAFDWVTGQIQALATHTSGTASTPGAAAPPGRREHLASVLDAIIERGDPGLAATAAQLRGQLRALPEVPGAPEDEAKRLDWMAQAARELRRLPDAAGAGDLAVLERQTYEASGRSRADRVLGLLSTLDAVEARDRGSAARVAILREALLGLLPADTAAMARQQRDQQRREGAQRAALDAALDETAPVPVRTHPPAAVVADTAWLLAARDRLRRAVAVMDQDSGRALPPDATADDLRRAAAALTAACARCHDTTGARIWPVAEQGSALVAASFSHAPHVGRRDCAQCHAAIERSTLATDVNLPGIGQCRACHGAGVAPPACVTCHRYHQPPSAPLRVSTWTMASPF